MPRFRPPTHWSLQQRLDHYSIPEPNSGCLLWNGNRAWNGYGMLGYGNRDWMAHRAAWTCVHGPIPRGKIICHRCDVRTYINPAHLFLGTHADNMADMCAKWRRANPAGSPSRPKLDEATVLAVRRAKGPQAQVAAKFGISQTQVSRVKLRRCWRRIGRRAVRSRNVIVVSAEPATSSRSHSSIVLTNVVNATSIDSASALDTILNEKRFP